MTVTRLPALGHDVLTSLYRHRLLSTSQLAELHAEDKSERWPQMVLADLERRALVRRGGIRGRREQCWYLSAEGHRCVEGQGVERRPYKMTEAAAVGPLQSHTLAVNAAALAFRRGVLARGGDWGGWSLEVAHPLTASPRGERLIVDAVVEATLVEADHDVYLARFLEVDRSTERLAALAAKLTSYSRLARHPAGWATYPRLPAVCVVIEGERGATERRIGALRVLAGRMALDPAVRASACAMADLEAQGPFAPIWAPLLAEGPPAGLLG